MLPCLLFNDMQNFDYGTWALLRARGFTPDKEVKKLESDGMALSVKSGVIMYTLLESVNIPHSRTSTSSILHFVYCRGRQVAEQRARKKEEKKCAKECSPFFQVLDACHTSLCVANHLAEEVGKRCMADLGSSCPV